VVLKKVWNDPVWSKVISAGLLALITSAAAYFGWLSAIWAILLKRSAVQNWLLVLLVLISLVFLVLLIRKGWKKYRQPRPRWFTWKEMDWKLLGAFFADRHLLPDRAGDINHYIIGPFCRNPECRREIPILDIGEGARIPFGYSVAKCPCSNKVLMIDFGREVVGMTEQRAVLVAACREAQAALRRGEQFPRIAVKNDPG